MIVPSKAEGNCRFSQFHIEPESQPGHQLLRAGTLQYHKCRGHRWIPSLGDSWAGGSSRLDQVLGGWAEVSTEELTITMYDPVGSKVGLPGGLGGGS